MVDKYPKQTIAELKKWNKDKYLWKARASLVPFAQCKSLKEHIETIDKFSKTLIKREERFCKTAVGWVLRETSKSDKKFVITFLKENNTYITSEVRKNAEKYF